MRAPARHLCSPPLLAVLVSLFGRAAPGLAGDNLWTQTGPAAAVYALAIDPRPGGVLYASTDLGLYRSDDHAETWNFVTAALGEPPGFLAVDPLVAGTIYASNQELLKSTDGGVTWTVIGTPINPGHSPTDSIAFEPETPGVLYSNSNNRLYRTQDGGLTWAQLGPLENVFAVAIDPQDPQRVYFSTDFHQYYSEDGVATWNEGLGALTPSRHIVPSRGASQAVYATADCCSGSGVQRSLDFGRHWSIAAAGLPISGALAIALDPSVPGGLFATGGCGPAPGGTPPPSVPPVFHSTNGGQTWSNFSAGLEPCRHFYSLVVDETGSYVHAAGFAESGTFTIHRVGGGGAATAIPVMSGIGFIALAATLAAVGALLLRKI